MSERSSGLWLAESIPTADHDLALLEKSIAVP